MDKENDEPTELSDHPTRSPNKKRVIEYEDLYSTYEDKLDIKPVINPLMSRFPMSNNLREVKVDDKPYMTNVLVDHKHKTEVDNARAIKRDESMPVQRKPLCDITEKFRTPKEERVFGVRNLPTYVKAERELNSHHDPSSKYVLTTRVKEEEEEHQTLPLVPVKTYRQETNDDFKPLSSTNNWLISTEKDIDERSDRNSRKNGRRKQKEQDSPERGTRSDCGRFRR
jgi:hypothetical protein